MKFNKIFNLKNAIGNLKINFLFLINNVTKLNRKIKINKPKNKNKYDNLIK